MSWVNWGLKVILNSVRGFTSLPLVRPVVGLSPFVLWTRVVQKFSRIKVYNQFDLPILLYRSGVWTHRRRDKKLLASIQMKCFSKTATYTIFDHKKGEEFLEELKVEPGDEKIRRYKSNLLRHVTGTDSSRMANGMLNCRPNGRRRLGRPLKGQSYEAETGLSKPNWWRVMVMLILYRVA